MKTLNISDDLYRELEGLTGGAFIQTVPQVIERLLVHWKEGELLGGRVNSATTKSATISQSDFGLEGRRPRERGIAIKLDGKSLRATSVRELYEAALKHFISAGLEERLAKITPFKTSGRRYLVAKKDTHPSGNRFVQPVKVDSFVMEAHKDYRNAVSHLRVLCDALGVKLEVTS